MKIQITQTNETPIIAIHLAPNHLLIARANGKFFVQSPDGVAIYTKSEMEEIYNIDFEKSSFEKLGWIY